MWHWLWTAINTYAVHPLKGNGYQFWSGIGSDLAYLAVLGAAYKHVNCEKKGCPWPGHRHPGHGRPVCRKHFHSDEVIPQAKEHS